MFYYHNRCLHGTISLSMFPSPSLSNFCIFIQTINDLDSWIFCWQTSFYLFRSQWQMTGMKNAALSGRFYQLLDTWQLLQPVVGSFNTKKHTKTGFYIVLLLLRSKCFIIYYYPGHRIQDSFCHSECTFSTPWGAFRPVDVLLVLCASHKLTIDIRRHFGCYTVVQ